VEYNNADEKTAERIIEKDNAQDLRNY